jgi:predicted RNA-binding protein with PIN domain
MHLARQPEASGVNVDRTWRRRYTGSGLHRRSWHAEAGDVVREILIDGYNLIRQSDRLLEVEQRQGLAAGRAALIDLLAAFREATGDRISVVFDGDDGVGYISGSSRQKGVSVAFSQPPQSADDVIIERIKRRHGTKALLVVSSDRAIQASARRDKVSAIGSGRFVSELYRGLSEGNRGKSEQAGAELSDDVDYWKRIFETGKGMFEEDDAAEK